MNIDNIENNILMYFYKIICNDPAITNIYIGSSIDLTQREKNHKSNCNNFSCRAYNLLVYTIIRNNGGWDNWTLVELEHKLVKDLDEALTHEQHLIEYFNANMNMMRARYIGEDYHCEYRQTHKDEILSYQREYQQTHKDEILAYQREYQQTHKDELLAKKRIYDNFHKESKKIKRQQCNRLKKESKPNKAIDNV